MLLYKSLSQLAALLQNLRLDELPNDDRYVRINLFPFTALLTDLIFTWFASVFFDKAELCKAKVALTVMKTVKQAMCLLCMDIAEEIGTFTARLMPAILYNGLLDIPDEILSRILKLDSYQREDVDWGRPEQLRLVSKRFQKVVLATPGCWSRIDDNTPLRGRRMMKNLLVDVKMTSETPAEYFNQYKDRIRHLDFDNSDLDMEDECYEKQKLPSIKSLVLYGGVFWTKIRFFIFFRVK